MNISRKWSISSIYHPHRMYNKNPKNSKSNKFLNIIWSPRNIEEKCNKILLFKWPILTHIIWIFLVGMLSTFSSLISRYSEFSEPYFVSRWLKYEIIWWFSFAYLLVNSFKKATFDANSKGQYTPQVKCCFNIKFYQHFTRGVYLS